MSSSDKNNENKHSKFGSAGLSKFNLKALEKFENVNFKSQETPRKKKHPKRTCFTISWKNEPLNV